MKTLMLLTALTVLFVAIGYLIGGQSGMIIAFGFAVIMNFVSYWFSDKIVLSMYRAKKVEESDAPRLYGMVQRLATQAGLPGPRVYIIPDSSPNAFATGRNPANGVVAFTQGILDLLSEDELEGVTAHELAHIKNRDILTQTIAATIAGAIGMLASMAKWGAIFGGVGGRDDREGGGGGIIGLLVMAIVAPIAAMFVQMAISRTREYAADATGAQISGKPLSLANALRKLHSGTARRPMDANPATAHMFIVNPLSGRSMMSLFSTHPPVEERIARLEGMVYKV
jgi:heat shock protein HtpX